MNAMLTKADNLASLVNSAQARLNLGVIETLLGEVFNTDNCIVIQNSNGIAFRFPHGLQICLKVTEWSGPEAGNFLQETFPAPFAGDTVVPFVSSTLSTALGGVSVTIPEIQAYTSSGYVRIRVFNFDGSNLVVTSNRALRWGAIGRWS